MPPHASTAAAALLLVCALGACGAADADASPASTDAAAACDGAIGTGAQPTSPSGDLEERVELAARAAEADPTYRPLSDALLEVQEAAEAVKGIHALGPATTPEIDAFTEAFAELRRQCEELDAG